MRQNKPIQIIIHHTAISRQKQKRQFLPVDRYHKEIFGSYCNSSMGYHGGYHIFIEADGTEYRYREDNEEGCHTKGKNITSLSVAMAGNFDMEMPTSAQIKTLKARIEKWKLKYKIESIMVFPHRKYAAKTCYGSLLHDNWIAQIFNPPPLNTEREEKIKQLSSLLDKLRLLVVQLQILIRRRR